MAQEPVSEKTGSSTITFSVRIPKEIDEDLVHIAKYQHKLSKSDLVRDWIVREASEVMSRATYQKWKKVK